MIRFHLREVIAEKEFTDGKRVTLAEIALSTGIHRSILSKIINQKGYVARTDTIDKLCNYFDIPVESLISHVKD